MENTYLIFGGNYGNLEATKALYSKAEELAIPRRNIICTGDMAAYCADAEQVADFVRQWGIQVIQGNCEQAIAENASDCGCGFSEETVCDTLSKQWYEYCQSVISNETKEWFARLPKTVRISCNNFEVLVCHGSPNNINRFVFFSDPEDKWQVLFAEANADIIIAGHCGIPFTKLGRYHAWHNSGALGMPANDGTPRVWFSTMVISDAQVSFNHHTLEYEYTETQKKMQKNGLSEEYIKALAEGYWPSLDILPLLEQKKQGMPLKECTYIWDKSHKEQYYG